MAEYSDEKELIEPTAHVNKYNFHFTPTLYPESYYIYGAEFTPFWRWASVWSVRLRDWVSAQAKRTAIYHGLPGPYDKSKKF